MKKISLFAFAFVLVPCASAADASPAALRNPPPECRPPTSECGCPKGDVVQNGCEKLNADAGEGAPSSGSAPCAVKAFADADAVDIFSQSSLLPVIDGYAFRRLGSENLSDNETPALVTMMHPNGEAVRYRFHNGSATARPEPGAHRRTASRLVMVDADGAATTSNPTYYDLYPGDGTRRRFRALGALDGHLGSFVSCTDARGVTVTPADMGVDVVYGTSGVRQMLTPSRLVDMAPTADWLGYDLTVHAVAERPAKGTGGLYAVPSAEPLMRLRVRAENGRWRKVEVFLRKGGGEERRWLFEYGRRDWTMTAPSGLEDARGIYVEDERLAVATRTVRLGGALLSRTESGYAWNGDSGFAMTNRVEGFGGVTNSTRWTYYTSGNGKGLVQTERRQSGLQIEYAYDSEGRVASETRSGPGMMAETTTYSYAPLADEDVPAAPADSRPRTVVRTVGGVEAERTYFLYAELSNVVERAASPGAAYGAAGALRTVTEFFPLMTTWAGGRVRRIRREDGRVDEYGYSMEGGVWTEKVTHLHESADAPVEGRTTRDFTLTNVRGETVETRTEAYVGGEWRTVARELRTHDAQGKVVRRENLAGQTTTTEWDCCHKISETGPDGSATTWEYDDDDRMAASSRLVPLDMTSVTWLTTCHEHDGLGRETATWRTNETANVGLPVTCTAYDALGRVVSRIDALGNTTSTEYSDDGRTVTVHNPNSSTRVVTRNADGDTLSVTGTAVTPEFTTYGILSDGTRWTRTASGETIASPRFTTTYENMLGQTVREERSGFRGALLATVYEYDSYGRLVRVIADHEPVVEYAYDSLGDRVATTRTVWRAAPSAPQGGQVSVPAETEWRRSAVDVRYVMLDGQVWLTETNTISCSDASIAPLVTSTARQLTGLSAAAPSRSTATDERGNATETWTAVNGSIVTRHRRVPYATNVAETTLRYGDVVREMSISGVTDTYAYDALNRQVSHTNGRGSTSYTQYNALGLRSASIDALGNRTAYAYDRYGNLSAVTNPLGNAVVYEYDLRGRKTYEGGATYPVRYTYDVFGNKTTMTTYRNESLGPSSGDVTTWRYDEASNCMTNKVYADGKGPKYGYTPDGRLSQRIWARGIVTDYSYDGWGSLTNTVYSDATPTVTLFYDAMGRQTNAVDAAGVTTFCYDDYGSLTNETVVGAAGENTIVRHWDSYGRTTGYSLVGRAAPSAPQRQTAIGYDPATGRIATMLANGSDVPFTWSYLPGSDLKSSLAYPNGLTASWTYDADDQLLQVRNAVVATAPSPSETEVISQYDYTYDAAGRRIEIARSGTAMSESRTDAYGYNVRNELISATKLGGPASVPATPEYAYQYDDIGNRITSTDLTTNRTYTANSLNQYTLISNLCDSASLREEFVPQFDDDGNQTLIQTSTGVWSVQYNGENRPVLWTGGTQSAATNIVMSFDRMGRRITKNNQWFVYNGYLQIANFEHSFTNSQLFIWDPTEPIATRPLVWYYGASAAYYTHDGNKNVSEVVVTNGLIVAHYEYVPFGSVIAVNGERTEQNIWRFSSEFTDDEIMLIYYNYRNYAPDVGRWLSMDPLKEDSCRYIFCPNNGLSFIDLLGLELVNINYKYGYKDFRKVGDISYVVNKSPCPTGWVSIDQVELNMSPIDFSKEKDFFQNFQVALMKTFEGYELKIPFTLLQSQWKGKGAVVEAWDESKLLPTKSGLKTHVRHCIKERFWIEVVESGFNFNIAWFGTFSLMRGEPYQFGESSYLEVCGPFCCTE